MEDDFLRRRELSFWSNWFIPRPFNEGYLPELDGHNIYFREFGNPEGSVIICFHGGPGYYSRAETATNFDLAKYRVIMFDQRGCGKSTPLSKLENNATQDILDDVVRLLDYLKLDSKVILFGGSWGSTLALLFAEQYPALVRCLLLSKIFLADQDCRQWELRESGRFYPDILNVIKGDLPDSRLIPEFYSKLINSNEPSQQARAVSMYGSYEFVMGKVDPKLEMRNPTENEVAGCKIYMHYSASRFMLEEDEIMDNIGAIKHIPTLIVHNRLDFVCTVSNAFKLHKQMQSSKLVIVPDMGHSSKMLSKTLKRELKEFLRKYGE